VDLVPQGGRPLEFQLPGGTPTPSDEVAFVVIVP